jgi:hypothetical protein
MPYFLEHMKVRWNSKEALLLVVPTLLLIIGFWFYRCPDKVRANIGAQPTVDAGSRAVIQRLSDEIQRCPDATFYNVFWHVEGDSLGSGTGYDPQKQLLIVHIDHDRAYGRQWCGVTQDALQAVAKEEGTYKDLETRGCYVCGPQTN